MFHLVSFLHDFESGWAGGKADIDTFVAPGVQAGISSWKCLQQRHDDDDDSTSPLR